MASGIKEIRQRAVEIIAAATPDMEPGLRYRETSYAQPLETLPEEGTVADNQRRYHVLALPIERIEGAGSSCSYITQPLVVRVRYDLGRLDDRDVMERFTTLAYSDHARIAKALRQPPAPTRWTGTALETIDLVGASPLNILPDRNGMAITEIRFRVRYQLHG